jgi:hypothetical protein
MCEITEAINGRYRTCTFVLLLYVSGLIRANQFLLTYHNPSLDSHPVFSAPVDVVTGTSDRVEVETTPSEVTEGLTSTFI